MYDVAWVDVGSLKVQLIVSITFHILSVVVVSGDTKHIKVTKYILKRDREIKKKKNQQSNITKT